MKTIIAIAIVFLVACNPQSKGKDKERNTSLKESAYSLVDYQRDSVYYWLDVRGDKEKEKLLVTREIIVEDSLFGGWENTDNQIRALRYADSLSSDETLFLYKVYIYEDKGYQKITELAFHLYDIAYPVLRAGEFSSHHIVFSQQNPCGGEDTQYLKIVSINNSDLNTACVNLAYVEGKWVGVSQEQLFYRDQKPVYCIDTTYCHDYTQERIRFSYSDFYHTCIGKEK